MDVGYGLFIGSAKMSSGDHVPVALHNISSLQSLQSVRSINHNNTNDVTPFMANIVTKSRKKKVKKRTKRKKFEYLNPSLNIKVSEFHIYFINSR